MALNARELFNDVSVAATPRIAADKMLLAKFKLGTGTLAVCAPVAWSTDDDQWVPFDEAGGPAGSDTIRGFVYPDEVVLDADEEVLGHIMVAGRIHIDDILAATAEADADVKADLQENALDRNFLIDGLVDQH